MRDKWQFDDIEKALKSTGFKAFFVCVQKCIRKGNKSFPSTVDIICKKVYNNDIERRGFTGCMHHGKGFGAYHVRDEFIPTAKLFAKHLNANRGERPEKME